MTSAPAVQGIPARRLVFGWIGVWLLFVLVSMFAAPGLRGDDAKILLIAGKPSHGPGDHEFRAGCLLLQQGLSGIPGVTSVVYSNGWPDSDAAFEGADAILIYADGGGGHPAFHAGRMAFIDDLAKRGVGIGCAHFGVEVPKGDPGAAMHRWIGGYYEHEFSVNPMWKPDFQSFPEHPVTRGVKPFALLDEWYFNMRWAPATNGVTPILVARPSDPVRKGPYVYPPGPYEHVVAASGRQETMMWVFERPGGGRGFGFTGGHKHVNWADDNFRKVVLNALLWIARVEVPANGAESRVAPEQLALNLDPKGDAKPGPETPNLTGNWDVEVVFQEGTGNPKFSFIHAGQNLIGRYSGRFGEAGVSGGLKGNNVRWSFETEFEGAPVTCRYTGTIENATRMVGTVRFGDFEGTWTARRQSPR